MSDYYKLIGSKTKAIEYAEKALLIDSQIYRFDHHYIQYISDRVNSLKN